MADKKWPIRHGDHEVELTRDGASKALNVFGMAIWALDWLREHFEEVDGDRPIGDMVGQLIALPALDACMRCVVARRGSYAFMCCHDGAIEVNAPDPETFRRTTSGYVVIGTRDIDFMPRTTEAWEAADPYTREYWESFLREAAKPGGESCLSTETIVAFWERFGLEVPEEVREALEERKKQEVE